MKKIEIHIPEDLSDKNSVFSHCVSFLRWHIWESSLEGKLKPLGNTELISEKNICWLLSKKLDSSISEERFAHYMREYCRKKNIKGIAPIKKYSKVSPSKVYVKSDIDPLINYIIDNHKK